MSADLEDPAGELCRVASSAAAEERLARVAWLLTEGIGATRCGRLIGRFGSATAAIDAAPASVAAAIGASAEAAARWQRSARAAFTDAAKREVDRCEASGVRLAMPGDAIYPTLLAVIPDAPPLLWVRGELGGRVEAEARTPSRSPESASASSTRGAANSGLDEPRLAVVGSRRASAYGVEQASRFAAALTAAGIAVVSGGARGIDAAAHRAALRVGGRTMAVLGSGHERSYPPEHTRLFDAIVEGGGAVVSEFPMRTEPRPGLFPRRNRIVSGMSVGVLVVEAARRSGALITARLAVEEHGREAMAVPGRVDSPMSAGCLRAIREGWASMVTSVEEVVDQLGSAGVLLRGAAECASREIAARLEHDTAERRSIRAALRDLSGDDGTICEAIVAATGLDASIVRRELVLMRVAGGAEAG